MIFSHIRSRVPTLLSPLACLGLLCCSSSTSQTPAAEAEEEVAAAPAFDADTAMAYIKAQTDMGPRVPGLPGHAAAARWLEERLRACGPDTVIVQSFESPVWNGSRYSLTNLWASFNPRAARRLLLVAHWDTRPWADEDADEANHGRPIDGANDGASGVAVLLEVARQMALRRPDTGVDILLVDGEDSGSHAEGTDDTWCLGSQHWARNMPYPDAAMTPQGGILVDMVGGRGARFHKEYFSARMAGDITTRVWAEARSAGYGDIFINAQGAAVNDDHLPIINAGIPTTDIIENNNAVTGTFPPTWHTMQDTYDNISPVPLKAVGQTLLQLIY